jgi:predicted dehydrogenase
MKLLVVGTGSIGKRHIKNLLDLGADVLSFSYLSNAQELDPRVTRVSQLDVFLESDIDAVVIANRTDQHIDVALQAARAGKHMFIEKPLAASMAGVNELVATVQQNGVVVEAGFMLHSHPNLLWIREQLAQGLLGEIWHMRAAVGQWLPDWRPGTDHRQGYGAFKALGGGVTFDLIHELDLVQWLLGPVVDVTAMMRQAAALEIETEAVAQIVLQLASGALAQVHLDYLRPGYGREMEIVGRHGVLRWDYVQGIVTLEEAGQVPRVVHRVPVGFVRNHLFLNHMRHFLQRLRSPTLPASSPLEEAAAVLRVALAAHLSAQHRKHVCPLDL